jgi:hypothetical protein
VPREELIRGGLRRQAIAARPSFFDPADNGRPTLRWLSLAIVPSLFVAPLAPLSMALNKTKIFLRLSSIEFIFKFPLMLFGTLYYGLAGVLVVRLATAIVVAACSMFAVRGLDSTTDTSSAVRSLATDSELLVHGDGRFSPRKTPYGRPRVSSLGAWSGGGGSSGAAAYGVSIFLLWRLAGCPDGFGSRIVGAVRDFWHEAAESPRQDFDPE